ncbi:MAG: hypothetical protein JNK87_31245 [Bryobacterales bacterium]|nr:hypothetical protein [Bryobacterales bacterium]
MLYVAAVLLITGALLFTLYIREQDLPVVEAVSPYAHLEDRKAQIYENLRDLLFEFRVGKLSDADYQKTKLELQVTEVFVNLSLAVFQMRVRRDGFDYRQILLADVEGEQKSAGDKEYCGDIEHGRYSSLARSFSIWSW